LTEGGKGVLVKRFVVFRDDLRVFVVNGHGVPVGNKEKALITRAAG